ncbi:MAG: class A beta-lactamase [Rhodobacteraceae bacterium]|nr:class A beta-lactamase [Paracoccaceae bacterium]
MLLKKAVACCLALTSLGLCLSVQLATAAAQDAETQALATTIAKIEANLDARVGVFIADSGSSWHWGHRETERFLMASTFKAILCGAVLERSDHGKLTLDETLEIRASEIHGHAPVTRNRSGQSMTIRDLCLATVDLSDNGGANLLLDRLGGPQAVTRFLRRIGDKTTRLDRKEPDLNTFAPGDPRDTTSPAAMVATWNKLLAGDALLPQSRRLLVEWTSLGGVTGALVRPHVPESWAVSDRSGGGRNYTRNIVVMLTPPGDAPYFVALYLSDTPANWSTRNKAVSEIGEAIVRTIIAHTRSGHAN